MTVAQPKLPGFSFKITLSFGGALLKGRRKSARTLDSKQALHVVLRSDLARGPNSLLRHARAIERIVTRTGTLTGVKVYNLANAGNHLHLVLKIHSRRAYRKYIKAITGLIAREVMGVNKYKAVLKGQSFWALRPFSRIVTWGKDFKSISDYLQINRQESIGLSRAAARKLLAAVEKLEAEGMLRPVGPPGLVIA